MKHNRPHLNELIKHLGGNGVRRTVARKSKPKRYLAVSNPKIGDVVFLPSTPDVKMTVTMVNRGDRITVCWINVNVELVTDYVSSNALYYHSADQP